MFKFTIENQEFLNKYYNTVHTFSRILFNDFKDSIINDDTNFYKHHYTQKEIATLIIINKIFFQNIYSFFFLIDNKLFHPAISSIRSVIEIHRLCRIYIQDDTFRSDYVENANTDFRNIKDREFVQGKIAKKLDQLEKDFRAQETIGFSTILHNNSYTQGSAFSGIHSELSKITHLSNSKLLYLLYIDDNEHKIRMEIDDDCSENIQYSIRKYLELLSHLLVDHYYLLNISSSSKSFEFIEDILKLISEYIELFYQ